MELETQPSNSNPSSPHVYVTAPTSPNDQYTMHDHHYCYSAPVSPRRKDMFNGAMENQEEKDDLISSSNFDDFEFETSQKFMSGPLYFGTSSNLEPTVMDGDDQARQKHRERGDLLPSMAFADELFVNGLVMPLKPPPRLQWEMEFNSFSQKSPGFLPKSPRTVCRIPFARRNAWNDDFDPFLVALDKVREEKRGRNGQHRRSRSYSPFRGMSKCSSDIGCYNQEVVPVPNPSYSGPLEFKGSTYARWVRDQTREGGFTSRGPKSPRWFPFGKRVRPVKSEHYDHIHEKKPKEKEVKDEKSRIVKDENKVLKLKTVLMRYTSFRGNKETTKVRTEEKKPSYFSRLSFKFKGNGFGSGKKKTSTDTSMAVVEYKPSLALCVGYGIGSPNSKLM